MHYGRHICSGTYATNLGYMYTSDPAHTLLIGVSLDKIYIHTDIVV